MSTEPVAEMAEIGAALQVLARRKRTWLAVIGIGLLTTLLLVVALPPKYRSSATILIEQQEIPQDLVRSMITSFADQRIQVIRQRVMTTQNLLSIIERYGLYPELRSSKPREVLLDQMRDDVAMNMISAEVVDPRSGTPTQATIAFSVSYENRSPDLALRVANELTTLYLNENLTTRKQQAEQTSTFLTDEAAAQAKRIAELEATLATFKEQHRDRLPELAQLNLQVMDRTELELRDASNRVEALEQQRVLMEAQLAQLSPSSALYSDSGQRILSAADRLKALRSQLASLKARYAADHPDVLNAEREIAGLEQQVDADTSENELARQLKEARGQLAAMRQRYSDEHPDVRRLQALIAGIESAMAEQPTGVSSLRKAALEPDNPVYIQVKGQLDALRIDRDAALRKVAELRAKLADYESRLARAPDVEKQYSALTRDLNNAQQKYQELRSKQTEAQVSQNLETERKGEKFTLIEPPLQPEKPISPNRSMILALGVFLSLALGLGAAFAAEALDGSVRSAADLRRLLEVPPLASIPVMLTAAEVAQRRKLIRYSWQGGLATMALAVVAVHFLVRPLDVLWLLLMRRFGV